MPSYIPEDQPHYIYRESAPPPSPGQALLKGMGVGTGVFFLSMLAVAGLSVPSCNIPTMATWSAAVAAAVAAYKIDAPLGRCLGIGVLTWFGSGLVMWFGGCVMGTLFVATGPKVSGEGQMMEELPKLLAAMDLWSIVFGLVLIGLGAAVGIMYGQTTHTSEDG
jgi:hypothetical protein